MILNVALKVENVVEMKMGNGGSARKPPKNPDIAHYNIVPLATPRLEIVTPVGSDYCLYAQRAGTACIE